MATEPDHLQTREDVARFLNLSIRSIDNLIARGCPHVRVSARCVRFRKNEVLAWLEAGGPKQTSVKKRGRGRPRNVDQDR